MPGPIECNIIGPWIEGMKIHFDRVPVAGDRIEVVGADAGSWPARMADRELEVVKVHWMVGHGNHASPYIAVRPVDGTD